MSFSLAAKPNLIKTHYGPCAECGLRATLSPDNKCPRHNYLAEYLRKTGQSK